MAKVQATIAQKENKAFAPVWNKKGAIEVGAKTEGKYLGMRKISTKYGETVVYGFIGKDGEAFDVYGSAGLNGKMVQVPVDAWVWLEYKGFTQSTNGNAMKDYSVEYDTEYEA